MDGSGATFAEVAVILQEMGRAGTPGPYLGSVVLGVGALRCWPRAPTGTIFSGRWHPAGRRIAVAVPPARTRWQGGMAGRTPTAFRIEKSSGGGHRLRGTLEFVPDAMEATTLLVIADEARSGPVVVPVGRNNPNLVTGPQPVLDSTRRFGVVTAEAVEVADSSVWRFTKDSNSAVQTLLDRGAVAVACDSLGLAEAMMDATVAYAGVRHQFGGPSGRSRRSNTPAPTCWCR